MKYFHKLNNSHLSQNIANEAQNKQQCQQQQQYVLNSANSEISIQPNKFHSNRSENKLKVNYQQQQQQSNFVPYIKQVLDQNYIESSNCQKWLLGNVSSEILHKQTEINTQQAISQKQPFYFRQNKLIHIKIKEPFSDVFGQKIKNSISNYALQVRKHKPTPSLGINVTNIDLKRSNLNQSPSESHNNEASNSYSYGNNAFKLRAFLMKKNQKNKHLRFKERLPNQQSPYKQYHQQQLQNQINLKLQNSFIFNINPNSPKRQITTSANAQTQAQTQTNSAGRLTAQCRRAQYSQDPPLHLATNHFIQMPFSETVTSKSISLINQPPNLFAFRSTLNSAQDSHLFSEIQQKGKAKLLKYIFNQKQKHSQKQHSYFKIPNNIQKLSKLTREKQDLNNKRPVTSSY